MFIGIGCNDEPSLGNIIQESLKVKVQLHKLHSDFTL
jgi:hypothetical protein